MTVKSDKSELGWLVREVRKIAGLSQQELAQLAGVGKTLIFEIEHGSEKVGLDNLRKGAPGA